MSRSFNNRASNDAANASRLDSAAATSEAGIPFSRAFVLIAASAIAILCVLMLNTQSSRVLPILLGIAIVVWATRQTIIDPTWLILALVLEETLPYMNLIPIDPPSRWWLRYPFLLAFCIPTIAAAWKSGILKRGCFSGFLVYFGWGAVSILYSLDPGTSAGRLIPEILLFVALSLVAVSVKGDDGVDRLLERYLIGCSLLLGLIAVTAFAMPTNVMREGDTPSIGTYNWILDQSSGLLRFSGIFYAPNAIGEVMLATVGAALLLWPRTVGWKKWALAAVISAAIVFGAMADSRSPFIALAIGVITYTIWRYRGRGAMIFFALMIGGLIAYNSGVGVGAHLSRDATTINGRTEAWQFEVDKLLERPFIGYGYEVEGAIFMDRHFPYWDEFWDRGPNTSLHEGYVSVAVGLGLPALCLFLYLILKPWIALFRREDDPWHLKPMFFLIALPWFIRAIDESGIAEPRGMGGLIFFLAWTLAERQRLAAVQARVSDRDATLAPTGEKFKRLLTGERLAAEQARVSDRDATRARTEGKFKRLFTSAPLWIIVTTLAAISVAQRQAWAANYYVDPATGNDTNSGADPSAPWRAIQRVNHFAFHAGDVVHLRRGAIFRETLRPEGRDGANFRGVSFVPYGAGEAPTINGSDIVRGWSHSRGMVFAAPEPLRVYNVFVDGGPGWGLTRACCLPGEVCTPSPREPPVRGESCEIGVMQPGSWLWSGDRRGQPAALYVWLADGTDPSVHSVEAVTREFGFHGYGNGDQLDNVVFDGVRIIQTGLRGISLESGDPAGCCGSSGSGSGHGISSLVIRHAIVERTGTGRFDDGSYGNAITIINATAPLVEETVVSYSGSHGNSINVQNSNGARVLNNAVDHWNHNGIDIKGSRNVLVEGNIARDQPSIGAGFYAEFSENVMFKGNRSSNIHCGVQISQSTSALVMDSQIDHAGTCIYFGPSALSLILRDNAGEGCVTALEGDRLANIVEQGDRWNSH